MPFTAEELALLKEGVNHLEAYWREYRDSDIVCDDGTKLSDKYQAILALYRKLHQ